MSLPTGATRELLIVRFKALTEVELPARAREEHWPLRLDHCFKRVCLDWACGDCWYGRIARPAEAHIQGLVLERAVQCATELLAGDVATLTQRNAASLRWRGKRVPAAAQASQGEEEIRP